MKCCFGDDVYTSKCEKEVKQIITVGTIKFGYCSRHSKEVWYKLNRGLHSKEILQKLNRGLL